METRASRRSGAVAAAAEAEWTAMLAELAEWKEENGGSMASLTDEDGGSKKRGSKKPKISKLGRWVAEMRKEKKEGRLSKDKEDKLNEIGFEWGGGEEGETMDASKIATAEGESSTDNVADGEGEAKNQKKRRRNPSRNAKKLHNDFIEEAFFQGELTQEGGDTAKSRGDADGAKRKAKKRKVGDQQWEQKFEELVRFKAQYGHFRIPVKEMPLLKYWAQNQKITYRKGKLSEERRVRLESVGFHWGKQRKGDTPQKGSDRQAVAAKTPSAAHGRLTSASGAKVGGEAEGDGSSGDEDEEYEDEDEEQQEVATTDTSAASSKKKAAKEGNVTTSSSSSSASPSSTATTPSNGASNAAARGAANPSPMYGQPKPSILTTVATHSNPSYIHPPTTSQFGSGKDHRMTAVVAGSNMNGPAAPMVDRFLTVREAREYIFSRIEVLERRQEETHRHMLELRQAFKGMERFIMQHFAREREMAERTRSMWAPAAQPLYGHETQPPSMAAGIGGQGYSAYPTGGPVAAGYPYYPQQAQPHPQQQPPIDPTKERERMVNAGYLPPQQHQPHTAPYPYSYPPPAGAPSPPVGVSSQNMHGAPHMSPALGPSGAYTGVLPHSAHNPYQSLSPHAGHPQARSQQPHHHALPPHHPTSTSASTMPASHQPGFYPPPHRASPVIGSPMPGGCSPEAVQTPEAHGLHFPRTPNAPSVTSVTPIPPSIVHQYPPPEEVAPTLSPPRPRLGDFTLSGLDPVGAAFPFLDENDEDDGSGGGGGGTSAVSGAALSRLDHLRHHHAAGEEDGGATETDENGEELLKQLDTFC
ncbi:helicase associated domain containing protein [Acanthamoeba castellanii str. Neff]|uniref:Helicase associated domain containing protein n=1 Tax=Acanthamoeba castellanii (strain ATCC 30010 / Neff) TaxID=1257118 RepID=L8GE69_ACACF|nr:helicase associated domain containing protein [Acanthamoeba castellanii str. Neff]ELR11129.1 helicase associated domain containing protein [Acanthamoeba castellanii str. Neff]